MENINKWLTFSEFAIVSDELESTGNKENVYTNTELDLLSLAKEDVTKS